MAQRMRTPKGPPSPGPATGFPVVIGPRSSLHRYSDLPWTEIEEAARVGRDGLRLAIFGTSDAGPGYDEFMLREMTVGEGSKYHGRASLFQQRW